MSATASTSLAANTHGSRWSTSVRQRIKTLYLVPHSHTDIGYTHDPMMVWELHDRFLDQAIALCEQTASRPAGEKFCWTIEVFATLEHWWANRDAKQRDRLLALMRSGQIDVGARRFNGTFLSDLHDIRWELDRVQAFGRGHGLRFRTAFNNDVNGFSLAYAQEMADRGVDGLAMGLNTTMGITPFPRPGGWRWTMPNGQSVLVWNGFIYNRIKSFLRVDNLASELPHKLDAFFATYPHEYPFDFAMCHAVVDDNTGPLDTLPEQVRRFNAAGHDLRLAVTTITGYMDHLRAASHLLPEQRGDWNDAWSFYLGSFPQCVAAARRAQRRLALVEGIRQRGWADVTGGSLTLDRGREELSLACEHTYGSHSSRGEPGSSDTQRQWAQIAINAWNAESVSISLLRDHLTAIAAKGASAEPRTGDAALLVNPTEDPISLRVLYEKKGFQRFAQPTRPEHLLQFDREPTRNAFEQAANYGLESAAVPSQSKMHRPLAGLALTRKREAEPLTGVVAVENDVLRLKVDPQRLGIVSLVTKADGREWITPASAFASGTPVLERLIHPRGFQVPVPDAVRDPSDTAWTHDHRFERKQLGTVAGVERMTGSEGVGITLRVQNSVVREMVFRLDSLRPELLEITVRGWMDDAVDSRALYLPFDFAPQSRDGTRFYYDSCGLWLEAGRDQIPGSATSHYAAWRGVAMEEDSRTIYLAARDTALWQFGDFTFGHPNVRLKHRPFAAAWLYNNYWFCNVPPCTPGGFEAQFLVKLSNARFTPRQAEALYTVFSAGDMAHPIQGNGRE